MKTRSEVHSHANEKIYGYYKYIYFAYKTPLEIIPSQTRCSTYFIAYFLLWTPVSLIRYHLFVSFMLQQRLKFYFICENFGELYFSCNYVMITAYLMSNYRMMIP